MRLTSKSAVVIGAGIVLLGTSLALSSAAVVSGANQVHDAGGSVQVAKKRCDTSGYCLKESNSGSGGGINITNNSSTDAALGATNNDLTAIYARSAQYAAIIGLSDANTGVLAESNGSSNDAGDSALIAEASNQNEPLFEAVNTATNGVCTINNVGGLLCTGGVSNVHHTSTGQRVVAYAAESATQTIEDDGTARMSGGVANVRIDPAFASLMDRQWYYVFVTPLGDTRGLYVSIQTPAAFQVRENEHGRDSVAFNYRIVAHPLDGKSARLPAAPALSHPLR